MHSFFIYLQNYGDASFQVFLYISLGITWSPFVSFWERKYTENKDKVYSLVQ